MPPNARHITARAATVRSWLARQRPFHSHAVKRAATTLEAPAASYPRNHAPLSAAVQTPSFVDNAFVASSTSTHTPLHDPATNTVLTQVPQSTPHELQEALTSAERAAATWRDTSWLARQQIMFRFAALLREHMDVLAASITREQGKTFDDARGDVLRGLQVAEAACAAPELCRGEGLEVARDMETHTYREPLGVVAAICPFNFPAMIPLWSIPLAVATGNAILVKPSERDPGAALIIAELARMAGLPPGVLNVVHGAVPTVDFLLDAPAIKAISFVGSNKAGEYIFERGSRNGKRVQANLGAKNHGIVLPDANKTQAINAIVGAAFGAAGQRCMALSTLVLVGETQQWLPDLVERAKALKVDGGFEEGADLGPVISPKSRERVERLVQSAEDEGARVLLDGRGYRPQKYPDGNFVSQAPNTSMVSGLTCVTTRLDRPSLQT